MNFQEVINAARFTVIFGKNGAGKSTLLRSFSSNNLNAKYISPERGGTLRYDPNVDYNIASSDRWLDDSRRQNRFEQFRQQSASQFRSLEVLILREIEKDSAKRTDLNYTFDHTLDSINALLPVIKLVRSDRGFSVQTKAGSPLTEENLSSGESELIALAIEVLVFSRSEKNEKILLLDEPDVHLHPDLQQKFISFVEKVACDKDFKVVIATHSTAIIGAFSAMSDLHIVPVVAGKMSDFSPFKKSAVSSQILPIFGAHPLSSIFNKSPVVLVEGEDDKRVIEQVVRSSNGRVVLSPCVVGTVSEMAEWENWLNRFLPSIYDEPKGYSLRDLDDAEQSEISDTGVVCRVRLNCYAIENLLLTTECFRDHGLTSDEFLKRLVTWGQQYPNHQAASDLNILIKGYENRRAIKIKSLRNIIVALLGSSKPWEVIVGQAIASYEEPIQEDAHSLRSYLGEKAIDELFG
ncbi:TPA: AAA family ATPase [Aeromonas dhakensis]|nr:AAA family ATPase [Aeromonas dhakensis]HDX8617455.1 AAA family ATPase [Aeromonas dhakensis]